MIYLYGTGIGISIIRDTTGMTAEELSNATVVLEELPEPEVIEGKFPMLYIDPVTKEVSYKYQAIKISLCQKLQKLVDDGKITQEEMNNLL